MKFSLMSQIDLYLGFPLCHLLAFMHKIRGKTKKQPVISEPLEKVLIIKFLGFGSILMTTPLMAELKKKYPAIKIHFLTFSDNIPICQSIKLIDKIIYLEKRSLGTFMISLLKNLRQIRSQNYDVLFNLEFFSNFSLLISSLSKAKFVLCFGGRHEYRKKLSQQIISYENETHIVDKFYNFLKPLNISPSPVGKQFAEVDESEEAKKQVLNLLKERGINITKDYLVLININASEMSSIRKWPLEYYHQVINFLLSKKNVKVILIGGREDVSYVSQLESTISSANDRIINLAGQTSLRELISLMKVSQLYLGNDSGPLHLAEACRLPNVSFFGPESPKVYGHPGNKNYTFYSNLPCSPCLNVYTNKDTFCKDNRCLKVIKPEEVINILEEKYFKKF